MKNFSLIAMTVYVFDVVTKMLVRAKLPMGDEISVFPFFSLVQVTNTGVAFGLFQGRNAMFAVAGVVLTFFLVTTAYRTRDQDPLLLVVLGLILAGALGNLTDRFLF